MKLLWIFSIGAHRKVDAISQISKGGNNMGSGQCLNECSQCKGVYFTDFDTHSFEMYGFCFRCGRSEKWIPKRNDKNQIICNERGEIQLDYESNFGYGCLKTVYKDRKLTEYTDFTDLVTEDKIQTILKELKSLDINYDECIFTVWDDSKKDIVVIVGNPPETFVEFLRRECADESVQ